MWTVDVVVVSQERRGLKLNKEFWSQEVVFALSLFSRHPELYMNRHFFAEIIK